jgi:hypothetical protein
MGRMIIRDDVIWAKHIDDPEIVRRILALPSDAPMTLLVDHNPVRFRKMRDGADGRPTDGLRPDDEFRDHWQSLQQRRGEEVSIELAGGPSGDDPYLKSTAPLLTEWNSPEDAKAYDGL